MDSLVRARAQMIDLRSVANAYHTHRHTLLLSIAAVTGDWQLLPKAAASGRR